MILGWHTVFFTRKVSSPRRRQDLPQTLSSQAKGILASISVDDVIELPDGRRWVRWDEEIPDVCLECGRAWADHHGSIEIRAVDGHLGRVLRGRPDVPIACQSAAFPLVRAWKKEYGDYEPTRER